jgi:hypothetical protein
MTSIVGILRVAYIARLPDCRCGLFGWRAMPERRPRRAQSVGTCVLQAEPCRNPPFGGSFSPGDRTTLARWSMMFIVRWVGRCWWSLG